MRRRRRLLRYAFGLLLLFPVGLYVNLGPYGDYVEARERYEAKAEEVALLERENAAYRSEIDRLEDDDYLEALARKELTYARPGEEVFIVKNLPEDEEPNILPPVEAGEGPGPSTSEEGAQAESLLDRLLNPVRALF
ncbi:MAG: hypothetical protein Kow00129_03260 [Thermoleophilia bacterium]